MKRLSAVLLCFGLLFSSHISARCWIDKGLGVFVPAVAGFLTTTDGGSIQKHGVVGALSCLAQPLFSGAIKNPSLPCACLRLQSGASTQEILVPYAVIAYVLGCLVGKYISQDQALSMLLKKCMGNNTVRRSVCMPQEDCCDFMMSIDDMPCSTDSMNCSEEMSSMDCCNMDCPQ